MLVEDHPIVSLGVQTLLNEADDFEWLEAADTPRRALEEAERLQSDLIVLNLMLGGRDGLELIGALIEKAPGAWVVVCSSLDEKIYARRALSAGAAGNPYVSEDVQKAILRDSIGRKSPTESPGIDALSNQELCVFRLIGSGLGSAAVAEKLGISPKTVGTHRERIKSKLGFRSARELERRAEEFFRGNGEATGDQGGQG